MPGRFCPHCGTRAAAAAKFCSECGGTLTGGGAPAAGRPDGRALGASVLAGLMLGGLAIWAAILSPEPPRPAPGGGAPRRGAAPTTGPAAAVSDHPTITLPDEAKTLLVGLKKAAEEHPDDQGAWLRMGQANYRAGQLDPSYLPDALAAFERVLRTTPDQPDALRGVANVHYDRNEPLLAIAAYERFLAVRPDDLGARTDLGTMHFYAGDTTKAIAVYRDVLRRDPKFIQAHVNLAVTEHELGDDDAARASLATARSLATDDAMRKRIDGMLSGLTGAMPPEPAPEPATPKTAFQDAVEQAFRGHPIMGPRIVRFEWAGPASGRVLVENFPMEGMPPAVREKFAARLGEEIRTAQGKSGIDGPTRMEIADAASGRVMATVTP